jgi:hypothetical protein
MEAAKAQNWAVEPHEKKIINGKYKNRRLILRQQGGIYLCVYVYAGTDCHATHQSGNSNCILPNYKFSSMVSTDLHIVVGYGLFMRVILLVSVLFLPSLKQSRRLSFLYNLVWNIQI